MCENTYSFTLHVFLFHLLTMQWSDAIFHLIDWLLGKVCRTVAQSKKWTFWMAHKCDFKTHFELFHGAIKKRAKNRIWNDLPRNSHLTEMLIVYATISHPLFNQSSIRMLNDSFANCRWSQSWYQFARWLFWYLWPHMPNI